MKWTFGDNVNWIIFTPLLDLCLTIADSGFTDNYPQQLGGLACCPARALPSCRVSRPLCVCFADAPFGGTPPGYAYDADRAEEQRRHHDMMPYIDDSPSSSPHLSSKSRGSRDTLSSGSLESTKSVSPVLPLWSQQSLVGLQGVDSFIRGQTGTASAVGHITWHNTALPDSWCTFKAKPRLLADARPKLQGSMLCIWFLSPLCILVERIGD